MGKHFSKLLVVLLAVLLLGVRGLAGAQPPPDNARGSWTIYSKNIDNGAIVEKHLQITQDGNRLWGHFEGPNQSGGITGTVNGHHIELSTKTHDVLTFRGQINGNQMSGMYGLTGRHPEFSAVRN